MWKGSARLAGEPDGAAPAAKTGATPGGFASDSVVIREAFQIRDDQLLACHALSASRELDSFDKALVVGVERLEIRCGVVGEKIWLLDVAQSRRRGTRGHCG